MTVSTKKLIAYLLEPLASNHVNEDLGYDAELIHFDGCENISTRMCCYPESIEFPNPVLFQGFLKTVRQTDYPITAGEELPLMSKRMVEILESVGSFPHNNLPARIMEGSIGRHLSDKDSHHDEQGNLKPEYFIDDYVLLQLTEHLDAMDLDRSEYDDYDAEMNWVSFVDKFVFKDIGREFPPIFRLVNLPTRLFISEAAKEALEAAGMKSLWLISYGDTEVENIFWE
jgi:hypothetical protein